MVSRTVEVGQTVAATFQTPVLFVIAGTAFLAEKTKIGSHLTGAVIAILAAIVAANLRIIPHAAPAYLHRGADGSRSQA